MNKTLKIKIAVVCLGISGGILAAFGYLPVGLIIAAVCAALCCRLEKMYPDDVEFDPFAEGAGQCLKDDLQRIKDMERSAL
jgi:hypothetical protein